MITSNAILEIHKNNLLHNYISLSKVAKKSLTAAIIKANAYGLGDKEIYNILYKSGCRHFFLATLQEAIKIRKHSKRGNLYVLNGLENNDLKIFNKFQIIPILNSKEEINKFIYSKYYKSKFKIGIHVDTGLNRLGIKIDDLKNKFIKEIKLEILISHFASADELKNSYNKKQNQIFKKSFIFFKSIKYKSLSNSSGILNNKDFHYDMVRPGISLYGGSQNINFRKIINIKSVITLKGKILQVKTINKNEYIGYNQTFKTKKKIKVAVVGIGYGDGIPRILSNNGYLYFKDEIFKIIGKVSMDSITVDISKSKKIIKPGKFMELINKKNTIDNLAKITGTISNEILTSISNRVKRIYR